MTNWEEIEKRIGHEPKFEVDDEVVLKIKGLTCTGRKPTKMTKFVPSDGKWPDDHVLHIDKGQGGPVRNISCTMESLAGVQIWHWTYQVAIGDEDLVWMDEDWLRKKKN